MENASYPTITIDIILDRHTAKDVLRGILHAILFHRLFGVVVPKTFEVLDVTVPGVESAEMEQLVDSKVDAFYRAVVEGSSQSRRGQIIVTFSTKRLNKSWFYAREEEVPWEQWVVSAEVRQVVSGRGQSQGDKPSSQTQPQTQPHTLTSALHTILTHTASERGRAAVPLISNADSISPFPVKIAVRVPGVGEVG